MKARTASASLYFLKYLSIVSSKYSFAACVKIWLHIVKFYHIDHENTMHLCILIKSYLAYLKLFDIFLSILLKKNLACETLCFLHGTTWITFPVYKIKTPAFPAELHKPARNTDVSSCETLLFRVQILTVLRIIQAVSVNPGRA